MRLLPATMTNHATTLGNELAWLHTIVEQRFTARQTGHNPCLAQMQAPPDLDGADGPYAQFLRRMELDAGERLVLALALAPHLAPHALDPFLLLNDTTGRRFSEFGGFVGQNHGGVLPTVETALFLLAGENLEARLHARAMFAPAHKLLEAHVLDVDTQHPHEPPTASALRLSRAYVELLLTGSDDAPPAHGEFPAERIDTPLTWSDLVLDSATRDQIAIISRWIAHGATLMRDWGLAQRLKPGYRCLFHGTPGTGKTLTACLLGKHHGLPVYRVDLSRIASKWIGETEKNLAALFDRAQDRNWILYFDEAEALFGRRTEAQTSSDRAANQQIAYLLQRLEDFPGMVILSTNQRGHMDDAFARRFQSTVLFPIPDAAARQTLWESMFKNGRIALAPDVNFTALAHQHPIAGGAIINVLRHACLSAVERNPAVVQLADIMAGVRQEMQKDGRYLGR